MAKANKFTKNDAAFTGLEAAIVLIAFVVVAAVFSYVMLGAGFFTSQTSKEVVHTGVDQATSSIQLSGDVIGQGDAGAPKTFVDNVLVTISLTAGNNPVDTTNIIITAKSVDGIKTSITPTATEIVGDGDTMLEGGEKFELTIALGNDLGTTGINKNEELWLEIKPPTGAILPIHVTAPPTIEGYMTLY